MKNSISFLLIVLFAMVGKGQDNAQKTLSLDEFYQILSTYHPVAKQAELLVNKAKKQLRASRGAFDPKVYSNLTEKDFKKKDYFRIAETGVKIPTWYGLKLKTAIERTSGIFLNNERNLPQKGLGVFGAELDLGKGFLMDERRANLRKAQIYRESSQMEKALMLNELFFEATMSYWEWVVAYKNLQTYKEAVALSKVRHEATKNRLIGGDIPAMDTLDTYNQLLDFQLSYISGQSDFVKTLNALSVFLWDENQESVLLTQEVVPPATFDLLAVTELDDVEDNLTSYLQNHPKIKIIDFKANSLVIDRRLKAEKLKPKVNLNYNLLTPGYAKSFDSNNFKWGFNLSIPIFLREGRGDLALAKLKIRDNEYKRDYSYTQIRNKTLAQLNEVRNLLSQNEGYDELVGGYKKLLAAEQNKFQIGESSMFKVNSRHLKLLNTQIKANKQLGKLFQSRGKLYKEMGVLHLNP